MTENLGVLEETPVFDHLIKLGRIHKEIIHAVGFARALRAGRVGDGRHDVFRAVGERPGKAAFPSARRG